MDPSDSHPCTDHYDYLLDIGLEDEEPLQGERDSQERLENASDPKTSHISDLPSPVETTEAQDGHGSNPSTIDSTILPAFTPITDLTIISRERVELPSSVV